MSSTRRLTPSKGHEQAHSEMVLIILSTLVISQILISIWKKYHLKTYNLATLLGLWLVPLIISVSKAYTTFILIWIIFSIFNTIIVKKALESPMIPSTPRLVYYWYQKVYDLSYGVGVLGYFIALMAFFHLPLVNRDFNP
jgi:RING finger protein 121/175